MVSRYPWYDSAWLSCFLQAKDFIRQHSPEKLQEFVSGLDPLRTRPNFEVLHLKEVLSEDVLPRARAALSSLKPSQLEFHEIKTFGRWVVHDNPILTELQEDMTSLVESLVEEPIETSYNFLSLYTKMGRCPVHMDAPGAKWTLDICVDQSEPWPIYFSPVTEWPEDANYTSQDWEAEIIKHEGPFTPYVLSPGEAILFSGSSQWHYREPLSSKNKKAFCHLLFFHFVPKGFAAMYKPSKWESHFGIPGLTEKISPPPAL